MYFRRYSKCVIACDSVNDQQTLINNQKENLRHKKVAVIISISQKMQMTFGAAAVHTVFQGQAQK